MQPASEMGERTEAIGTGAPSSSTTSALHKKEREKETERGSEGEKKGGGEGERGKEEGREGGRERRREKERRKAKNTHSDHDSQEMVSSVEETDIGSPAHKSLSFFIVLPLHLHNGYPPLTRANHTRDEHLSGCGFRETELLQD